MEATLIAAGFHRPNFGPWRRKEMAVKKRKEKPPATAALEEVRGVIDRSKQGDINVPALRELLEVARLSGGYGDLAAQAEAAWVGLAAGEDLYLRESLFRQAAAMRGELATASASPIEKLLVERVVMTWLQLAYHDAINAQALQTTSSPGWPATAQAQEMAHRQHLSALAALTMRKLLLPATPPPPPLLSSRNSYPLPTGTAAPGGYPAAPIAAWRPTFDEPPSTHETAGVG